MSERIEKIGAPLVKHQLFESIDNAFETITLNYIQQQLQKYSRLIKKFEKKYKMNYTEFQDYTKERARKLNTDPSTHEEFIQLEDDAFDWKVAVNGLASWEEVHREIERIIALA
ncbi:MAG: hypothetical protein GF353_20245 [Candidatus Lokiarchaeota archaeon]|nr:hypothetical protein [Candidatus Lokiarchaeota archaeon]